jgi:8-oxo-dGTP diphosphatase
MIAGVETGWGADGRGGRGGRARRLRGVAFARGFGAGVAFRLGARFALGAAFFRTVAFARAGLRRRFAGFARSFATAARSRLTIFARSFAISFSSLRLRLRSFLAPKATSDRSPVSVPLGRRSMGYPFTEDSLPTLRDSMPGADDWDVAASPRRDSAFVVIVRRSRVLLVRSWTRARWQLPGGAMKRRESPMSAALRETEEETGLRPRIVGLAGTYRRADGSVAVVFTGSVAEDAEPSGPRNEIREQRWVRSDKAMRLLSRGARQRLEEALAVGAG